MYFTVFTWKLFKLQIQFIFQMLIITQFDQFHLIPEIKDINKLFQTLRNQYSIYPFHMNKNHLLVDIRVLDTIFIISY